MTNSTIEAKALVLRALGLGAGFTTLGLGLVWNFWAEALLGMVSGAVFWIWAWDYERHAHRAESLTIVRDYDKVIIAKGTEMLTIWISCWDCGTEVEVPQMGKYQTKQICQNCKDERKAEYERLLAESRTNA